MMTEKTKSHGGKRPGAGRPRDSVERIASRNLKHFRERYPVQPLDDMMNDINAPPGSKGVTNVRRDRMAMAAAPYVHQRLSALEPDRPKGSIKRLLAAMSLRLMTRGQLE